MFWSYFSTAILLLTGILLIIIILLQRGRGGGLAGAFGGLGGQSAFGTKAGDVFTKITVALAVFWVALSGLSGLALERDANRRYVPDPSKAPAMGSQSGSGEQSETPNPLFPDLNEKAKQDNEEGNATETELEKSASSTDDQTDAEKKNDAAADQQQPATDEAENPADEKADEK